MSIVLDAVTLPLAPFTLEVSLDLRARATALYGPSGSGKTSILECIAGLRTPLRGSIALNGRVVFDGATNLPPRARHAGYVPQDDALFPHMTVRRNILYSRWSVGSLVRWFGQSSAIGSGRGVDRRGNQSDPPAPTWSHGPADQGTNALADQRTNGPTDQRTNESRFSFDHVVDVLDIAPLLDRGVRQLSGGERKRVALARALLSRPEVLLLDEPLAGVDVELRTRVLDYLLRVRDEFAIPTIYVTHQREEANAFCEEIAFLERGRITSFGRI